MSKEKMYTMQVTDRQLALIRKSTEFHSRMLSGQLRGLRDTLVFDSVFGEGEYDSGKWEKVEKLLDNIKYELGLQYGESKGIAQSSEMAKELYEIYYMINHYFKAGVYEYEIMKQTDKPLIQIQEDDQPKD